MSDKLREALEYWMPKEQPFYGEVGSKDFIVARHIAKWHEHKALLAESSAPALTDEQIAQIGLRIGLQAFMNANYRMRQQSAMTVAEQEEYDNQILFARAIAEAKLLAASVSPGSGDVRATESPRTGLETAVFLGRAPIVGEKWRVRIGELANVETKYLRDVTARTVELAPEMNADGMRFRTEDVEFIELAEQPPAIAATKGKQP